MNTVIAVLEEYLSDRNVRFVFPSDISAGLWARKTCTLGIARSVETGRFLAWDRFKEKAFREKDTVKEPAAALTRKLFAESLIRKNAEALGGAAASPRQASGFPFQSLIPPEYARNGKVFAPFIAHLLPSLASWEKLVKSAGQGSFISDAEDEDYAAIKKEYAAFLKRHGLFEPSWEEISLNEDASRYVIFFPELIEDFSEYDAMLRPPRFIRIYAGSGEGQPLLFYHSAREEIRGAVTELQRLHREEGVPYEDMAVSVPELEEMEPCLVKELSLHDIPFTLRTGKKLGESGAGRLFSLVNEYAASRFSFASLKALLLNDHIPWKEREKNKALIKFGIEYNCVSGYTRDGRNVDIWEEAFDEAPGGGKELRPYYMELKKRVLALAGAESFAGIRKFYFAFRGYDGKGESSSAGLLDMEKISKEDDAVLGRCIEELGALIELEEKFDDPALVPSSPFAFFLSCLGETEYVRKAETPGVNIFRWRVAAASPFAVHFVLNASQGAASVLYQPMKFLRQDKRKALGLEDRDASGAFFLLSGTGEDERYKPRIRISASAQTFSGWAIPHSFFAQGKTADAPPCPEDPYGAERRFWRDAEKDGEVTESGLKEIFLLQKKSFYLWKDTLARKRDNFSFFHSPVPEAGPVRERLRDAILNEDGFLTVSPTGDLNLYYECPLSWLYKKIFKAGEYKLEAALLDDTALGKLYHVILEKLFARIRDEDGVFSAGRLDVYKAWALEITGRAIREERAFKGPLAVPLVLPQSLGIARKIAGLLEKEAEYFGGYRVEDLETDLSYETGKLIIEGRIDRVSVSPDGMPVIVDYKSTKPRKQTAEEKLEEERLSEFQMPIYVKLYEKLLAAKDGRPGKVEGAFFYSISERKITSVMGGGALSARKVRSREDYKPFIEAAEKQIEEFGQKVNALDFIPGKIKFDICNKCVCKTACRSVYSLNSGAVSREKEG